MKKLLLVAILGCFSVCVFGQGVVIPDAKVIQVKRPVKIQLTADQLAQWAALIASGGVTLPSGVNDIEIQINLDGTASVRVGFFAE